MCVFGKDIRFLYSVKSSALEGLYLFYLLKAKLVHDHGTPGTIDSPSGLDVPSAQVISHHSQEPLLWII